MKRSKDRLINKLSIDANAMSSYHLSNQVKKQRLKSYLELDYFFLIQAQVHAIGVFEMEGAFMQLADRIIRVQKHRLLVHFANDLKRRQRNSRKCE